MTYALLVAAIAVMYVVLWRAVRRTSPDETERKH
jgi:hypothetical protein